MLLVEDAAEVAEIIKIAFRRTELNVQHCADAPSALEYLEHATPDVIILDIGLPGMNGWQFLDVIREQDNTKNIPIIVLTSFADYQNRKTGRLYDVDTYLTKPIDLSALRTAVDNAIYLRE